MRTALVVSADETLRTRLRRSLDGRAVFAVGSDEEALRTLRFTAVDLIVKEATPIREVPAFIERARQICPTAVVVCVLTADPPPEDDPAVELAGRFNPPGLGGDGLPLEPAQGEPDGDAEDGDSGGGEGSGGVDRDGGTGHDRRGRQGGR